MWSRYRSSCSLSYSDVHVRLMSVGVLTTWLQTSEAYSQLVKDRLVAAVEYVLPQLPLDNH
jgi:hypothetical protein